MSSPAEAAQAPDSALWLRLDPRMLLVHPVREVGRFLPALVALVFVGGGKGARTPSSRPGPCRAVRSDAARDSARSRVTWDDPP